MHSHISNSRHKIISLKFHVPKIYGIIMKRLLHLMQNITGFTAQTFYFIHWTRGLRKPKIIFYVLVKTKDSAPPPYKTGFSS